MLEAFTWPVAKAGYRWDQEGDRSVLRPVRPRPEREYVPFEEHSGLFLEFASTEPTREGVLAFANRYGLLGPDPWSRFTQPGGIAAEVAHVTPLGLPSTVPGPPPPEPLALWQDQIRRLQGALATWQRLRQGQGRPEEVEAFRRELNGELVKAAVPYVAEESEDRPAVLTFWPLSLRGALWLQFARAVSDNKEFRACRTCGRQFELSPAVARLNRQFCSDACRSKSYRQRQEEARRLHGQGKSVQQIAEELESDTRTVKKWIQEGRKG